MAGIKERLVQLTLRAKEFLSRDVQPASDALQGLVEDSRNLKDALNEAGRARGLARTLRDSEGATDSLRQAWKDAQATLEDLTREVGDSEQATAGQRIALREARRSADEAQAAYDRSQRAIKNLRTELKALNVDTDNIAAEEQRLTAEIEQNKRALDTNRDAIKRKREEEKKAADTAKEHASRVGAAREAMSSGARQVLAFAATFVGLNALLGLAARGFGLLRDGIGQMLQTGDQFEGLQVRMNALMGSVAAGEAATAWVKDFAKRTPLELQEVTDAFAQLQAYGVDPMNGTLQALVDQNEKLGGGMERLGGIIGAVGQAYAKQKLQTEEILQLVERGVPVWDMLAKVTGKSAAQLQELATKGKLGRDVLAELIKEIGKSSTGAAEAGMSRLSGIVSNLKDQFTDFLNRIANAGALEYVKNQLTQLGKTIAEMDRDGRLDRLAKALSNAFVQGAEKVKELARELLTVDFKKLTDDSTGWLNEFGEKIDQTVGALKLVTAPVRAIWNVLTGFISGVGTAFTGLIATSLSAMATAAQAIPNLIGGDKIVSGLEAARDKVIGLSIAMADQVKQDAADVWNTIGAAAESGADKQAAAVQEVAQSSGDAAAAAAAGAADSFGSVVEEAASLNETLLKLVSEGKVGLADLGQAVDLINTASTVQQLESLRSTLLTAFQAGKLSQEEYAQATTLLNGRLNDLGSAAAGASDGVSDLEEKLGDLASVQAAISNAKTDVDINNIKSALRKLYEGGTITAAQYNEELKKTADRQRELKGAVSDGAKEQDKQNEAMEEAIQTQEDLRRASGKRMEEERRAGGEAMERRRKEGDDAKKDMAGLTDFFGAVLTRAREPLAQLSAASLEAFDRIRGISTVKVDIDTSSLEATAASLQRVNDQLASVRLAAVSPGMSGFSRWQLETQRQSLALQEAALGQKLQLQQLMARYESGGVTLGQFVKQAQSAKNSMNLLDAADLSSLDSAIQSAKDQMKQLGESTRSTLEGLQDELDGLEGREAEAERRRFGARQRELEAQLAQAQASGDGTAVSNAQRALGVLRQIEAATALKRQQEDQQKRVAAAAPAQASQPASPTRVLRLVTANGKAVDVAVNSAADETKLLSILEDAGLRSL